MDKIVYVLITQPGGVDGRDHTDNGGTMMMASYDKSQLEKSKALPWCKIESMVVDVERAKKKALFKLNPIDRLMLGI